MGLLALMLVASVGAAQPFSEPGLDDGFGCGVNGPIVTSGSCTMGCDPYWNQHVTAEVSGVGLVTIVASCGGAVATCSVPLGALGCEARSSIAAWYHDHSGTCTVYGPLGLTGVCNPS